MENRVGRWLTFIWIIVIFALCWLPQQKVPTAYAGSKIPHLDKIAHTTIFAVLGIFGMMASRRADRRHALRIWGLALGVAIVSEAGQGFEFVARTPDWTDGLWDMIGASGGIALACGWRRSSDPELDFDPDSSSQASKIIS